jgi:hypothetical protein
MITAALALAVGLGIFIYTIRRNPKAPQTETEDQLKRLGYTGKEAKREARAQRNEHRAATRTTLDGIKAGSQAARAIIKIGNKLTL